MLMIRLQRVGRAHEPVFRLVLTDSKNSTKSGKFLEILGHYDARTDNKAEIKAERVKHWISHGAQLTDTVHNMFVSRKIIEGKKINKLPKKKPLVSEKAEEEKVAPAPTATEPQTQEPEAPQPEETQKVAEETTV